MTSVALWAASPLSWASRPRRPDNATPPPGQAFPSEGESRAAGPQTCVCELSWHGSGARQLQEGLAPDMVVSPPVSAPTPPPQNHRGTELTL
ncbi:hypothetical protein NDU88_003295 [Pleurodeles waltl]|uniref:Secreted protein n=1 Tax=Pleurodeles waltl TaxID=8319 RepID=A0AAV7L5P2_PLEWA|nr:hypothetical protein NDU88_003295 [Pleurodeles waltl]